jgi:ACS family hexuronate transporter-like MFS transporter
MVTDSDSAAGQSVEPRAASRWLGSDIGFGGRWLVCWLLFLVTSINYLDRQVFGLLIPDLQQSMHISELAYARLVMAFQLSYALMMIAAGRILDRIGARVGLAIAVLVWSLAEMGHAFVRSTLGFGFARFFLGAGEAANFPACMKVITDLFPAGERATATGIVNSATAAGAIAAPIIVPLLASLFGWQSAFVVTGFAGFLWLIVWYWVHIPNRETSGRHISSRALKPSVPVRAVVSWRTLLGFRQLWAFALARILVDPIWYFYLFWLPKFLAQEHGIRGSAAAPYLSAVFAFSGLGCIASGYLSSALVKSGWSVNWARKTVMWTLVAIMCPTLVAANQVGNVTGMMTLICVAVGAHQALSTHLYTLASDLFPSRVIGMVVGLGSCLSGLASVITAELIGRVLEHNPNSYTVLFVTAACLYPAAMLAIQALSPRLAPAKIMPVSEGLHHRTLEDVGR